MRELAMRPVTQPQSRSDRGSPAPPTPATHAPRHRRIAVHQRPGSAAAAASGRADVGEVKHRHALACATRRRRPHRSAPAARAWSPRSHAAGPGRKPTLPSPVQRTARPPTPSAPPKPTRLRQRLLQLDLLGEGIRPASMPRTPPAPRPWPAACIRITVLTSTFHLRVASACEELLRADLEGHLHFSSGESCRRLRRLPSHHHILLVHGPNSQPELV